MCSNVSVQHPQCLAVYWLHHSSCVEIKQIPLLVYASNILGSICDGSHMLTHIFRIMEKKSCFSQKFAFVFCCFYTEKLKSFIYFTDYWIHYFPLIWMAFFSIVYICCCFSIDKSIWVKIWHVQFAIFFQWSSVCSRSIRLRKCSLYNSRTAWTMIAIIK